MSLQDFLKVVEMWWKEVHSTDHGSDEEDEAENFLHFHQISIGGPKIFLLIGITLHSIYT